MRDRVEHRRGRFVTTQTLLAVWGFVTALAWPSGAAAQTGANVLVVINSSSAASKQVGEYYATARMVPDKNVVRTRMSTAEAIERTDYERTIEQPIAAWLARHSLQDQVLYIVLTKGVPLRIIGTSGRNGTAASVDSELTLLYRRLVGTRTSVVGRVDNPYFLNAEAISDAKPFTRHLADIYLVTRLDGYTIDDVIGLIDRGRAAVRTGSIVLDQSGAPDRIGDRWLQEAADRLTAMPGTRATLESTPAPAKLSEPVLGYFSWGSNDAATRPRRTGLSFSNGALAGMFVSTDGRTFSEPQANWMPGARAGADAESLAGDLIREGVTGIAANVSEPFLDATVRPQILFPAYLSGFNLAESFYLAMPAIGWQGIVVGDPLCAPFRQTKLSRAEIDKGMDLVTELPALFAERRLARLSETGLNPEGLRILLRADARLARDEATNIEPLLKRALEVEPRLTIANTHLAAIYEARSEFDKAIEQYRAAIAVDPENAIALNNLAYALAERKHQPREALPHAEKAYRLAPLPGIADTLGWIHHLLGDEATAARWLEKAVADAPNSVDILVHAAIVHAALNDLAKARLELQQAAKLDPRINERPDVQVLRARLKLEIVETRVPGS
jgi:uncharacterized protein (TIGR03790 family)